MEFSDLLSTMSDAPNERQKEIDKQKAYKDEFKKKKSTSPFEFINSICDKEYILNPNNIKEMPVFMVIRGLQQNEENIPECQEANKLAYELSGVKKEIYNRLIYDFLYIRIRGGRYYKAWTKKEKYDDLELIKRIYEVSDKKAINISKRLTKQQIKQLKDYEIKLKGGQINKL